MISHVACTESNIAVLRTEPDVIIRAPVTTQPAMNSLNIVGPWSYMSCGPSPLARQSFRDSVADIFSNVKSRPLSQSRETVLSHSGSRDWSKDLFDSFKEVHKSKQKCSALMNRKCCEESVNLIKANLFS